jgi:tRNA A37 N6-isopentenylltransferase MiaA
MFILLEAKKDLEDQLSSVDERLNWVSGTASTALTKIEGVAVQRESRMVMFNEFTTLAVSDVRLQFSFFKTFLEKNKPALEADIEHKLHKGVSKEQVTEITAIYTEYGKDKSGSIDKKELRAALLSLGEEALKEALDG